MATHTQDNDSTRTGGTLQNARRHAADANQRIGSSIESAPLVALAAGVVVGAVAGALLPRTERETEVLGAVGSKIGQAAAQAAKAAREAGKEELGLLSDAKSPMETIVEKAIGAVTAAGSAAASTVSRKQDG